MALSVGGAARSTCAATTTSCIPTNITFGGATNKADVYFNTTAGISVGGGLGDTITQSNSRTVSLDSNGATGTIIELDSGSTLTVQ
jgi:hypothetical protein